MDRITYPPTSHVDSARLTDHDRWRLVVATIRHRRRLGLPIIQRDIDRLLRYRAAALQREGVR